MLKRNERDDANSCWNKAAEDERLFVLLGRDPAAPAIIRAWCAERIRLGLNSRTDSQILSAESAANLMELERAERAKSAAPPEGVNP